MLAPPRLCAAFAAGAALLRIPPVTKGFFERKQHE
jgi:hypothetical protein